MKDQFKIYIDRLRGGEEEHFEKDVSSDFLDIQESELHFFCPIQIKGVSYLANDQLILKLGVQTKAQMPCSICNQMSDISISIPSIYFTIDIVEIKDKIFDFSTLLRDSILLEVPHFTECNEKNCPERKKIDLFLKKESKDHHFPFQGLQP